MKRPLHHSFQWGLSSLTLTSMIGKRVALGSLVIWGVYTGLFYVQLTQIKDQARPLFRPLLKWWCSTEAKTSPLCGPGDPFSFPRVSNYQPLGSTRSEAHTKQNTCNNLLQTKGLLLVCLELAKEEPLMSLFSGFCTIACQMRLEILVSTTADAIHRRGQVYHRGMLSRGGLAH